MKKKCCGCDKEKLKTGDEKTYCEKHALQIKRHGKILERTRFDPNEIVILKDWAEIILYDRHGQEIARSKIDLEDVEKCKEYKWHRKVYKTREYVQTKIEGKNVKIHQLLLEYYAKYFEIDHINGDGLDNRKSNLRKCTHQENMMNQRVLPSNNKSGHIGVYYNQIIEKWIAQIKYSQKNIYLGAFKKKKQAIAARKLGEIKYFGENKFSNFEDAA